jgi:hypothetical protein
MMVTKERINQDIATLSEFQLRQVAEFLDYLKFKEKSKRQRQFDQSKIAELYKEFGEEDREFAENDLTDFAENLKFEDAK